MSMTDEDLRRRPPGVGVTDWVFRSIKREILENRLRPDEILVEGTLANRFDVSRGAAREALQQLRRTGLVRAVHRVGYIVTAVSLHDYDEVFQLRLALEPLATELATIRLSNGRADTSTLDRLVAEVEDVVADQSPLRARRIAEANASFHKEIARLSGNQRLARSIGTLMDDIERVMHLLAFNAETLEQLDDDHPALLRTMKRHDPARARDLMASQLEKTFRVIRACAVGSGTPMRADSVL